MTIIPFPKKEQATNTGKASCLVCRHNWQAVAPVGVIWLECPKCKFMKGCFVNPCEIEGVEHWTCNCKNQLFYITREGCYCPNCGEWQRGF